MRPQTITDEVAGLLGTRVGQLAALAHKDADAHGLWDDFRKEMTAFTDLPDDIRLRAVRYYATSVVAGEVAELRAASEDADRSLCGGGSRGPDAGD